MARVFKIPDPPPGLELSQVPNIQGADEGAKWVSDNLGIPVTERYIRVKTNERQIVYSLIGGKRFYSSRALYDFIMTRTKEQSA